MSIVSGFILLLLLLPLPLPAFAGSLEGLIAYRKGDFATALREFGTDEQGNPASTYFLALMNLRGGFEVQASEDIVECHLPEGQSAAISVGVVERYQAACRQHLGQFPPVRDRQLYQAVVARELPSGTQK